MQTTSLESLIGSLIDGQEELLQALGVAELGPRAGQPRATAVVRRITEQRQLRLLLSNAHSEAALLLSGCTAAAPCPQPVFSEILNLLTQGVATRVLFNSGVREEGRYAGWTHRATALGAEVRWITEEFKPMIVVDGRVALMLDGSACSSALLISEPTIVTFLTRVFATMWSGADRAAAAPECVPRRMPASTRESIIDMLVTGNPDKTIAKRLGISLRSVQAHIATLRAELGANTRAQLGYQLARGRRASGPDS